MMIVAYLLRMRRSIIRIVNVKLVALFLVALVLGGVISVLQYQSEFTFDRVTGNIWYVFFDRMILNPSMMASRRFMIFDDPSTFLHGRSIRWLSVFGVDNVTLAPSGFVSDLWTDFGWIGVIVGSILLGYVYQYAQLKMFRRKTTATLSLYVIMLANSVWIIYGRLLGTMSMSVFVLAFLLSLKSQRPTQLMGNRDKELKANRYSLYTQEVEVTRLR